MVYKKIIFWTIGTLFLVGSVWVLSREPSHEREWEVGLEKLPSFEQRAGILTVKNFRNFDWEEENKAKVRYETRVYDLASIEGVDVFISHFSSFKGMAHIFLSFRFTGQEPLVLSVETRREKGEVYSPLLGLFRTYEVIYVVGSENDLVGARTDVRNERVYLFPTVASPDTARTLLLRLSDQVNRLDAEPRFYHTLLANCTNLITREVEKISPVEFPLTWKTILPGYFDDVLFQQGLIDEGSRNGNDREQYKVENTKVDRHAPDYSEQLRAY